MLLANYVLLEKGEYKIHLCLIPHKFSAHCPPIKVDDLNPTDYAVTWIGPGEGVTVKVVAAERAKIIEAYRPAIMYITPSTDSQPGIKVNKVKIIYHDDRYEIFYSREAKDNWVPFKPNEPRASIG